MSYMMKIDAKDRDLAEERVETSPQIIHACLLTPVFIACMGCRSLNKWTLSGLVLEDSRMWGCIRLCLFLELGCKYIFVILFLNDLSLHAIGNDNSVDSFSFIIC